MGDNDYNLNSSFDSLEDAAPAPRRKFPRSLWLAGFIFAVMGIRTTRIDKLPSFELLMEESIAFSSYLYYNATNTVMDYDFTASWGGGGEGDENAGETNDETRSRLSLDELMSITITAPSCPYGTRSMGPPKKLPPKKTTRIPRMIHQADISQCVPDAIHKVANIWKNTSDFEYYFHTNKTMQALINQDWPEFPHLRGIVSCISNFKGHYDLWKALVLWEFGGAVFEFDWVPREEGVVQSLLPDGSVDQALVFSLDGWPKEMALFMEPKHPMAFYFVMHILNKINMAKSLHTINWSKMTGLDAFIDGWYYFMGVDNGIKTKHGVYRMPLSGFEAQNTYHGRYNRSAKLLDYRSYFVDSDVGPKWRTGHYPILTDVDRWNVTCMHLTHDVLVPEAPPAILADLYPVDTTTRVNAPPVPKTEAPAAKR
jgi:hypothetical protein